MTITAITRLMAFVVGLLLTSAIANAAEPIWFRILLGADQTSQAIGHAAFRRGNDAILIFAANLPIEQDALRQITGLPAASVVHLPGATELSLPIGDAHAISIQPEGTSFAILPTRLPATGQIVSNMAFGHLHFTVDNAGPVIAVADERTGNPLLVGTVTGDATLDRRLEGPGFATLPAWSGVVLSPVSDELDLTTEKSGFLLRARASTEPLPIGNPPVTTASLAMHPGTTGELDLPRTGIIDLRNQMNIARREFAASPPSERLGTAQHLAKVMLSLGLGPETRGALDAVLKRVPSAVDNQDRRRLLAVADVIAHRPRQALMEWPAPSKPDSEAALWRGLAEAEIARTADAARLIAQGVPHFLTLPTLLRARMASLAAETLVAGNQQSAAAALFAALPHDRALDLARAMALESAHHTRAALASYSKLTHDNDQRIAGISLTRATLLRFQLHKIDASNAADALSHDVYVWRSPSHELNVRLAMAELRAKADQWPLALTGLLRAKLILPQYEARIDAKRRVLFDQMIKSGALDRMQPLAAVAVIQNNTDLIPTGKSGLPVLTILARHLVALDLPEPAASIMRRLIPRMTNDVIRARLGLNLARIELGSAHLRRAQAAIDTTAASDLPDDLVSTRLQVVQEITARRLAATVNSTPAEPVASPALASPTLALTARLAAGQKNWPRALSAFRQFATRNLPASGILTVSQSELVSQWASTAAQAGDHAALSRLRQRYLRRLAPGNAADMFDTITAPTLPPQADLLTALRQIAAIERVGAALNTRPPTNPPPDN